MLAQVCFLRQLSLTQTHMNKIRVYFLSIYNDCHALATPCPRPVPQKLEEGIDSEKL